MSSGFKISNQELFDVLNQSLCVLCLPLSLSFIVSRSKHTHLHTLRYKDTLLWWDKITVETCLINYRLFVSLCWCNIAYISQALNT